MVPEQREKFNSEFTRQRYQDFVAELDESLERTLRFRVNESPLFLSEQLGIELPRASLEIMRQITASDVVSRLGDAVPPGFRVPTAEGHSYFIHLDFAISRSADGEWIPQLIELQGFPSLYGFQYLLNRMIRKHFDIPQEWSAYYSGFDGQQYLDALRSVIVAECDPLEVVLLEHQPARQVTQADFFCMQQLLGIPTVCVSDLRRVGSRLAYSANGRTVPIRRIYNRVIFDQRNRAECALCFDPEIQVKWVGHPNWYFKLSKFVLPLIRSRYAPPCQRLSELDAAPADLDQYVLKPLYAFAGQGVIVSPTRRQLEKVADPHNYLLQRRVEYTPVLNTPHGASRVEVRMMFLWPETAAEPILVNNLIRTSRGPMMGVTSNQEQEWVGASVAYHR